MTMHMHGKARPAPPPLPPNPTACNVMILTTAKVSNHMGRHKRHLVCRVQVTYMTNSGSEANDLALRICRAAAAAAGRRNATHVAVMGGAYHGHLTSLMAMRWGGGGAGVFGGHIA